MKWKTVLLLSMILLNGCGTPNNDRAAFCDVAKNIRIQDGDILTRETAAALLENRCDGIKLCGWPYKGVYPCKI